MATLLDSPVLEVLNDLFDDAASADAVFWEEMQALQRQDFVRLRADHRAMFSRARGAYLAVPRQGGELLYVLVRARRPAMVVEFGTSFGISAIYLASGLRDNGCGRLITTEIESEKIARAAMNIARAGLADLVEFRPGDAIATLSSLACDIELLFLDGAYSLALALVRLLEPRLPSGAIVIANNPSLEGDYAKYMYDPACGYVSSCAEMPEIIKGRTPESTVRRFMISVRTM